MRKNIFIISGLILLTVSGFGQAYEISLNQPDLLSVSAGSDTLICVNNSIVLGDNPSATGGSNNYTYLWSPMEGLDDPTSPNPVASPLESTQYTLTVSDGNGCQEIDFVDINVDFCLGIDQDLANDKLTIYPNPSYGSFTISGLPVDGQDLRISLINSLGDEILNRWIAGGAATADFDLRGEGIAKGVYFFQIKTGTQILMRRIQII